MQTTVLKRNPSVYNVSASVTSGGKTTQASTYTSSSTGKTYTSSGEVKKVPEGYGVLPSGNIYKISETSKEVQAAHSGAQPEQKEPTYEYYASQEEGKPVKISKGVYEKIKQAQSETQQGQTQTSELMTGEQMRSEFRKQETKNIAAGKSSYLSIAERKLAQYTGSSSQIYARVVEPKVKLAQAKDVAQQEAEKALLAYRTGKEGATYEKYLAKRGVLLGASIASGAFNVFSAPIESGAGILAGGALSGTAAGSSLFGAPGVSIGTNIAGATLVGTSMTNKDPLVSIGETAGAVAAITVVSTPISVAKAYGNRPRTKVIESRPIKQTTYTNKKTGTTVMESQKYTKVQTKQGMTTTTREYYTSGSESITRKGAGEGTYKALLKKTTVQPRLFRQPKVTKSVSTLKFQSDTLTKPATGISYTSLDVSRQTPTGTAKSSILMKSDVVLSRDTGLLYTKTSYSVPKLATEATIAGSFSVGKDTFDIIKYGQAKTAEEKISTTLSNIGKSKVFGVKESGVLAKPFEVTFKTPRYETETIKIGGKDKRITTKLGENVITRTDYRGGEVGEYTEIEPDELTRLFSPAISEPKEQILSATRYKKTFKVSDKKISVVKEDLKTGATIYKKTAKRSGNTITVNKRIYDSEPFYKPSSGSKSGTVLEAPKTKTSGSEASSAAQEPKVGVGVLKTVAEQDVAKTATTGIRLLPAVATAPLSMTRPRTKPIQASDLQTKQEATQRLKLSEVLKTPELPKTDALTFPEVDTNIKTDTIIKSSLWPEFQQITLTPPTGVPPVGGDAGLRPLIPPLVPGINLPSLRPPYEKKKVGVSGRQPKQYTPSLTAASLNISVPKSRAPKGKLTGFELRPLIRSAKRKKKRRRK